MMARMRTTRTRTSEGGARTHAHTRALRSTWRVVQLAAPCVQHAPTQRPAGPAVLLALMHVRSNCGGAITRARCLGQAACLPVENEDLTSCD